MRKIKGYDEAKPYTDNEKLPAGGYIIGILDAEEVTYDWGSVLLITFDIAEGDYKNFYTNQYKSSQMEDKKYKGTYRLNLPKEDGSEKDEWAIRRFKTATTAIEASNPGYHWDWNEKTLIGKKVGAIFFEKEYDFDGRTGFYTTVYGLKEIETIKEGKFKIPERKLLDKNNNSSSPQTGAYDFADLGDDDEELPF